MSCQEFLDSMPELAGGLGAEALAHARECAACRLFLDRHAALAAGLRRAAAEARRVKAPGRIEAKLLAEFRGQTGLAVKLRARHWWAPAAAWAMAAAVVAAAALLFATRVRQPETPGEPMGLIEMASTDWSAALPAEAVPEDSSDDFIPLPDAGRLPPDERINLVRVEVPRSTMIALGYAPPEDRPDAMVEADVVLGSDGLARAVRLVNEEEDSQ
jgi:hypothetical protein